MKKDCVNILVTCGYGQGSSAIAQAMVTKELEKLGIKAELKHAPLGELGSFKDWADIVTIPKNFLRGLDPIENIHIVDVINALDGKTIAKKIEAVVMEYYPDALKRE